LKKKESKQSQRKEEIQKEVASNKQAADKIAANKQVLSENENALQLRIGTFELEKKKYELHIQEVNAKEAGFKGFIGCLLFVCLFVCINCIYTNC
jgi:hypothetical protein